MAVINVKTVTGVLESHGQGLLQGDVKAKKNVVIKTDNGELKTYKVIGALGTVGNYLEAGISGTFHMLSFNSIQMVIAISRDDGAQISDLEAYKEEYERCKHLLGHANFLMFLGVITIPLMLFGLLVIGKAIEFRKTLKPMTAYDPADIKSYLVKERIISV